MKISRGSLLLLIVVVLEPRINFAQKQDRNKVDQISQVVIRHYIGLAEHIDADETSFFTFGNFILRKNDEYAVLNEYGTVVIPYGKYLFETPLRETNHYKPVHFAYWMTQVRSPETGLYGFIDINGIERIPLKYNEVTPVTYLKDYNISAYSVGTLHTSKGKTERYLLSAFLDNPHILIENDELADQLVVRKDKQYWVIQEKNRYDGFTRFFNLAGDTVFVSPRKAEYYGGQLFKVDSTFNGLKKTEFIDYQGNVVSPFQMSDKFSMTHFQPLSESGSVALLTGLDRSSYDYALMNDRGEIYSRLKSGDSGMSNYMLWDNDHTIRGDRLLISAKADNGENGLYLWDVNGEKNLKNIETLFLEKNSANIGIGTANVMNYQFEFISREADWNTVNPDIYIKFRLTVTYKPIAEIMAYMPWGTKNYSSGIGGGQLYSFTTRGYGLMNQTTGEIIAQPIYHALGQVDYHSDMVYAELIINDVHYKGFVRSVLHEDGNRTAPFQFLLKE